MKTLNDFFSNIYCINLDSRPDRYEQCVTEFEKLNIVVERVSGVDGRNFGGLSINAGAYGLLLTHIKILNDAIANKYQRILILEDDVTFIDGFYNYFNEKISELPDDWDMLYLGGNNVFGRGKFNLVTGDKNFLITHENYKTLNHEICKTTWTQCAHALGVNSKFYDILLDAINKNSVIPVDSIHCRLQQLGYNTYTFLPSLALQRASFSNIENTYVDYNKNDANGF